VTPPICRSCPIRVKEQRLFGTRYRCGIHGLYIDLSAPCTLNYAEVAIAKQFLARILASLTSDERKP